VILSKVRKISDTLCEKLESRGVGFDPTIVMSLLGVLLKCFADRQKPVPPKPPESLMVKTQAELEAWATACAAVDEVQTDYVEGNGDYSALLVTRTKRRVKHDRKKNGEKPSPDELEALAIEILDHTRTSTPAEIYPAALEAQQ
jgi:hypothetical protein